MTLTRTWTFGDVLVLAAVVLFVIAFCVAMGWFGSNFAAWALAGLAVFAAAHLPWRTAP